MPGKDQTKLFEALFRKFQPVLVKFAYVQLRSREEAREAVQEVFINIWLKRDGLELGDELKAYLYRSVRNNCLNRLKRNRPDSVSLDENLLFIPEEKVKDGEEKQRKVKMIFREIENLPPSCKEIFMMSRIEGLSHKEISNVLDISAKTVENQVGIALKKIRSGVKRKKS